MAAITTSGTVIQVQSIVSQLMQIEQLPASKLDSKIATAQAKVTAYGNLKSRFSTLESAAWALSLKSSVDTAAFKATSTDEGAVKVTASGASGASTHSITVSSLAQNHAIATKEFANATDGLVTGDFDLSINGVTKKISLTNASLNDVASAINGSGAAAKASVIYGTSGYRLVVSSNDSGAKNALSLSLSAAQSGVPSGDADFAFGGGGSMVQTVAATDANLVVDGVAVSRSSNVISDVVQGATLSLQKTTTSPATINVARDSAGVKEKLQKLVDAYNDLGSYIKLKAPTGPDTKGDLKGETSINNMMSSLRQTLTESYGPVGMQQLSSIGVSFQKDGTLKLDSEILTKAVNERYDDVTTLLTAGVGGKPGVMKAISTKVKDMISTDGALGSRTDGLNNSIRNFKNERIEWDGKLVGIEKRLLAQYSRLDASLAKMQSSLSGMSSLFNTNSSN
jgi:flagellar hook-associated protein 2